MENPAQLLQALSDSARARVFAWMVLNAGSEDATAARCARELGGGLHSVAKTIARLVDMGMLTRDGNTFGPDLSTFRAAADALDAMNPIVVALESHPQLSPFFEHGRLVRSPMTPEGTQTLAAFLASLFEEGRSYTEAEANVLLSQVSADFASLRRLVVDFRLVTRTPYGDYRRRSN
ncbi:DUF2087 domain-containing protein [Catenulispora sp. NL8]|uniref:DUF2087 domain-containing protein n=1 Tax=Catenulispora pinistramenti TaxID=2705254 RepID=A0ABS5L2M2_9ACTN|nr:DUF2087 domain-containing protein [Catenulispora pinistramenti]MBS2552419.1 DUF2087 domain-containing protein [Catenulispora pinistramenti]